MVTPEFGSKRADTIVSMIGKMLSLLVYIGLTVYFSDKNSNNSDQDKLLSQILIPLSLIFIGGYAFRDDLRLIPELVYGAGKGMVRACKGSAKHVSENVHSTQAKNDQVVDMQGALNDDSESDRAEEKDDKNEPYLSNGLTNPDGTPVQEKDSPASKAHMKSQHDSEDDSVV